MRLRAFAILALMLCVVPGGTALSDYRPVKLDTVHSRIEFEASTLLFDVEGRFKKYTVEVDGDPKKPTEAKVRVVIDVASIDTDNKKRDDHLRSADFFDATKYPKITFVSDKITRRGSGLSVTGTLEMHGSKKQVTMAFKVASGKNGAGVNAIAYKGALEIDRTAFGIGTDSVAAKISLEDQVGVTLLLVTL